MEALIGTLGSSRTHTLLGGCGAKLEPTRNSDTFSRVTGGLIRLLVVPQGVAQRLLRERLVRLILRLTSAHPLGQDQIWLKRKLVVTKIGSHADFSAPSPPDR